MAGVILYFPFSDSLTINKHLPKLIFYSLYDFKNLKSSSTWFNPCFPLRRAFLLLYVESIYLLLSISEANTCVNFVCINSICLLIAFIILLCVDNIHEIYMLKVESNCWNLNLPLCWLNTFYLESIALWVNSYAKLFDACLESTIHEKFLLIWFSCLLIIYLPANYRPLT